MSWPPTLTQLKDDLGIELLDTRDDERLTRVLDAAVSFVENVRPQFNYTDAPKFTKGCCGRPLVQVPQPTADHILGTLRLAGRWHTRRRSPDMLIQAAELGASRVPGIDPDLEKLLRIGRWAKALVG